MRTGEHGESQDAEKGHSGMPRELFDALVTMWADILVADFTARPHTTTEVQVSTVPSRTGTLDRGCHESRDLRSQEHRSIERG